MQNPFVLFLFLCYQVIRQILEKVWRFFRIKEWRHFFRVTLAHTSNKTYRNSSLLVKKKQEIAFSLFHQMTDGSLKWVTSQVKPFSFHIDILFGRKCYHEEFWSTGCYKNYFTFFQIKRPKRSPTYFGPIGA